MISILMPLKNDETHISQTIDSIIGQTYKNWELLIIDDYSTDNSLAIVKKIAKSDLRIKYYKNNNPGIIPALKLALSNSQGQFITRMDSDDLMAPLKLELLRNLLMQYGTGYITTGLVEYFSDFILQNGFIKYQNWLNNLTLHENNFNDLFKECPIASPCWLIYKTDLISMDGLKDIIYPEDYDFCFKLYKNNFKIKSVKKTIHFWRDHPTRASRNCSNYKDQSFYALKIKYIREFFPRKNYVIWGAGTKGKKLAKYLIDQKINFTWVTNNPNKITKNIYNIIIESTDIVFTKDNPLILLAFSSPQEINQVNSYLNNLGFIKNKTFINLF